MQNGERVVIDLKRAHKLATLQRYAQNLRETGALVQKEPVWCGTEAIVFS